MPPRSAPDPDQMHRLLVKAIRSLSQREQDTVLAHLLGGYTAGLGSLPATAEPGLSSLVPWLPAGSGMSTAALRGAPATQELTMVPVRLSKTQYEGLKRWCADHEFAMAVVLRGLVERFLEEEEHRAS